MSDISGSEGCWNKIAWAFLKPIGINNTFHTGKKVRLQLYKPRRSSKKYGRQKCEVYIIRYASHLFKSFRDCHLDLLDFS